MTDRPKKRSGFFQELKRRNVYRVIAMYAGAAFVIIEVINNVVDPLRLPEWLPTIVILLLIIGFPVTAILSWIFDLTPEGMKKTAALEDADADPGSSLPERRRLRPSDIVILVLLVAVGILGYPKIFHKDKFLDARDSQGRIPLAVLPFENLTRDTMLNAWQGGLQDLLITGLSNSEELAVRQYQSTNSVVNSRQENYAGLTPKLFREVASQLECQTLISGSFLKAGDKVRMDAKLLDAESSEIYKTFQVLGSSEDDFFSMADSMAWMIRNFVEIKNIKEKRNSSIITSEGYTRSSEAFKYYLHGVDAMMEFDMAQAIDWLTRAVEADSMFINAQIFLAHSYHMNGADRPARQIVISANEKKDNVSVSEKLRLEHLYAYFFETPNEEMKYIQQLLDLDEMNPMYWHMLATVHYRLNEFEEAAACWEHLFELHKKWGSEWQNPFAYFMLADAYHELGESEKEGKILEEGSRLFPQNGYVLTYQVIWALAQDDTTLTNAIMKDYLAFRHNVTHCPEALISNDMGFIYTKAGKIDQAEDYYRSAIALEPQNVDYQYNLAKYLIDEEAGVDEGLEIVDRLLEQFPGHWELMAYKGWGLYKKGQYAEAAEQLQAGWEKKPIYNHMQYLRLQEVEKAVSSSQPTGLGEG